MIHNRESLPGTPPHETALACVEAGIEAAHPERVVREAVQVEGTRLEIGPESHDLSTYESVLVVGGGNAAAHVAVTLEAILGEALDGGIVVTDDPVPTATVDVRPADHPVPSQRGVESTSELLDRAVSVGPETLVIAVITGGGSACMVAPASGISLVDLQATTNALLESGASIHEVNAVRKHLSAIKGGQLARALAPARVSALVLSDVLGDDLDVVASGPLVADPSTYADALDVLDTDDLTVPDSVRHRLAAGAEGDLEETPGPDDPAVEQVTTHLVGTNMTALAAAREEANERGYETLVLSSRIRGEARDAALAHVAVAEEMVATGNPVTPPAVVLSGGETTVTVAGEGRGGPNQELALAAALDLSGEAVLDEGLDCPSQAVLAAVDTDGIDGNTDAAGALVDGDLVTDPATARRALDDNDANAYLGERGALVETGPTGTNVNDLRVLVVGSPD
jgi:hydroxypyruvate reductase